MSDLYERLGAESAIEAVVDDFYDRVLDDERVNGYFDDVDMARQRRHQTQFLIEATGGPSAYDGDDVAEAHEGLGITGADFAVIAEHLTAALAANGVDEADREAVMAEVAALEPAVVE